MYSSSINIAKTNQNIHSNHTPSHRRLSRANSRQIPPRTSLQPSTRAQINNRFLEKQLLPLAGIQRGGNFPMARSARLPRKAPKHGRRPQAFPQALKQSNRSLGFSRKSSNTALARMKFPAGHFPPNPQTGQIGLDKRR